MKKIHYLLYLPRFHRNEEPRLTRNPHSSFQIPDAQADVDDIIKGKFDTFVVGTIGNDVRLADRLCGRFFNSADNGKIRQSSMSICSKYKK